MTLNRRPLLGACVVLVLGLSFGGALAHSKKEGTTPADGAVLSAAPAAIALRFDRSMRVTLIRLTDAEGAEHALTRTDKMAPVKDFRAVPEPLGPGSYSIEWRGLSGDGHPMSGSFSFEIRN